MQLHSVYCNCLLDVIWPGAGSLVSNSVAICRPINRHAIQQDIPRHPFRSCTYSSLVTEALMSWSLSAEQFN